MVDKFEFCKIYCKDGEKFSVLIKVNMIKELRDELKQDNKITYLDHGESEHEVKSIRICRAKRDKVSCSRIVILADGLLGSWEDIFRKKSDLCEDSFKHLEVAKYCVIRTDLLSAQRLLRYGENFKLIKPGNYVFDVSGDNIKRTDACADCKGFLIRNTIVTEGTTDFIQKQEEETVVMCGDSLIRLIEVYTYPTEDSVEVTEDIIRRIEDEDYGYDEILMQDKDQLKHHLVVIDEFLDTIQDDNPRLESYREKLEQFRRRVFVTFQQAYMRRFKEHTAYSKVVCVINAFSVYDKYDLEAILSSRSFGEMDIYSSEEALTQYDNLKDIIANTLKPMEVTEEFEPYKQRLIVKAENFLDELRKAIEGKSDYGKSIFTLMTEYRRSPNRSKLKLIEEKMETGRCENKNIHFYELERLKDDLLVIDTFLSSVSKDTLGRNLIGYILEMRGYYVDELVRRECYHYNNLPTVQVFKQMYERFPSMKYVDCIILIKVLEQLPMHIDVTTEAVIKQDIHDCAGVYSAICVAQCKVKYEKMFVDALTDTMRKFLDNCKDKIVVRGRAPRKFSYSEALDIDKELLTRPSINNFIELHREAICGLSDKNKLTNKHIKGLMDACEYLSNTINLVTCAKGDTNEIMALSNILVLFTTTLNEKLSKKYEKASNSTKGAKIEAFKA